MPWAARASCWPLPQQLLPASAAGGGRRRCTLRIFSGKNILNFAFVALCGARQTHFHGRGRRGKRHLHTLPGSPSQALTRQLSQRESPWQSTQTSSLCQGLSLWERWHRAAMTERARTLAGDEPSQAHCVRQLPRRGSFIGTNRQMAKSSP